MIDEDQHALYTCNSNTCHPWVAEAIAWLHLEALDFTLYACRHGGPSEDRSRGARTTTEVQRRGRWMVDLRDGCGRRGISVRRGSCFVHVANVGEAAELVLGLELQSEI